MGRKFKKGERKKKRAALLARDGRRCWLCDKPFSNKPGQKPSIDHVIPSSKGGTNALVNLKLAHFDCNFARGNSDILTSELLTEDRDERR